MKSSDQNEAKYLRSIADRISEMKVQDHASDQSDSQSDSSRSIKSRSGGEPARRANALRIEAPEFNIHRPTRRAHILKAHPDDDMSAWLAEQHRIQALTDVKTIDRQVALSLEFMQGEARKIGDQLFDLTGKGKITSWDGYLEMLKKRLGPQDALVHAIDLFDDLKIDMTQSFSVCHRAILEFAEKVLKVREEAIDKLPPEQQAHIRAKLERYTPTEQYRDEFARKLTECQKLMGDLREQKLAEMEQVSETLAVTFDQVAIRIKEMEEQNQMPEEEDVAQRDELEATLKVMEAEKKALKAERPFTAFSNAVERIRELLAPARAPMEPEKPQLRLEGASLLSTKDPVTDQGLLGMGPQLAELVIDEKFLRETLRHVLKPNPEFLRALTFTRNISHTLESDLAVLARTRDVAQKTLMNPAGSSDARVRRAINRALSREQRTIVTKQMRETAKTAKSQLKPSPGQTPSQPTRNRGGRRRDRGDRDPSVTRNRSPATPMPAATALSSGNPKKSQNRTNPAQAEFDSERQKRAREMGIVCHYCKKKGHYRSDCPKRKALANPNNLKANLIALGLSPTIQQKVQEAVQKRLETTDRATRGTFYSVMNAISQAEDTSSAGDSENWSSHKRKKKKKRKKTRAPKDMPDEDTRSHSIDDPRKKDGKEKKRSRRRRASKNVATPRPSSDESDGESESKYDLSASSTDPNGSDEYVIETKLLSDSIRVVQPTDDAPPELVTSESEDESDGAMASTTSWASVCDPKSKVPSEDGLSQIVRWCEDGGERPESLPPEPSKPKLNPISLRRPRKKRPLTNSEVKDVLAEVGAITPSRLESRFMGARRAVAGIGTPEGVDPYLFHEGATPAGTLRINATAARAARAPTTEIGEKIRAHIRGLNGLTRTTSLVLASKKVCALLDNGADISAIELKHVPKGVAVYSLEPGFAVSVANDQTLGLVGMSFLKFRTPDGRKMLEHPLFVVERLNCPLILGLDFLERHKLNWNVRDRRSGREELTWVTADGDRVAIRVHKRRKESRTASLRLRLSNLSVMKTAPMAGVMRAWDPDEPTKVVGSEQKKISRIEIHVKTPGRGIVVPPRGVATLRVDTQINEKALREEYVLRPCEDALQKLGLTGASTITRKKCLASAVRVPIMNATNDPVTIPDSLHVVTCYALDREAQVFEEEAEDTGLRDTPKEVLQALNQEFNSESNQEFNHESARSQTHWYQDPREKAADWTEGPDSLSTEVPTSCLNW